MKILKKVFLMLLVLLSLSIVVINPIVNAVEQQPTKLVIHYFRYSADYSDNWNFWMWQKAPVDSAGATYNFDKVDGEIVTDSYGAVATIDLSENFSGATKIGVIIKKGEWVMKDIDTDRFIDIPETSEDGIVHRYFVEGDTRIGTSLTDPNGPERTDKIRAAFFSDEKTINYSLTTALTADKLSVELDGVKITDIVITPNGNNGQIKLSTNVDMSHSYVLKATFDEGVKSFPVTFDGLYDSTTFEAAFGYDGDDLGATISNNNTTFKLWAPISNSVVLNIYNTGTPASLGGKDTKVSTVEMTKGEKGVWSTVQNGNLHGKYYTYSVTNGNVTNEVVDPYAKTTGVNGLRGMVIDFAQVNPQGFEYNKRASNITNPTDAIIYELHVRDLTSHSSWTGPEEYRGKYMGLTVEGTSYNGVTTGLDHIKELGVTHVQLLPIFDHGVIDESKTKTSFNWGYMPDNYNALEGSYATDAFDGSIRVQEFKQASMALNNNNIGVIMDVVYNHTGKSADSNLNLIVPGYYYRYDSNGAFSNGSGCGNETASERYMMRKFMVDSVCFWATEYNLSGFRFDLMALHDVETMNAIYKALQEIDENILVYGEPWNGGTTVLNDNIAANKVNLESITGVGAFNDDTRDAIKGSVFSASEQGYIQGVTREDVINKIKYGVVGGVNHIQISSSSLSYQKVWHTSPSKTINYVSAHDNNTLYDKIMQSTPGKQAAARLQMQKQANAIVLTSQGIPFLHAGAEFMRTKPAVDGGYDENSYESPDSTNQLRWDLKAKENNLSCFNYYKQLIALRKNHPAFRMTTADEVNDNLSFLYEDKPGIVAYTISNYANNDTWGTILVIHSSFTNQFTSLNLPVVDGTWNQVADSNEVALESFYELESGTPINIYGNETLIFYSGERVLTPTGCGGCASSEDALPILLFAIPAACYFLIRRKNSL